MPSFRLTGLDLPLDHSAFALREAVLARLRVRDGDLESFTIFRRAFDARKRSDIRLVYTIDAVVAAGVELA